MISIALFLPSVDISLFNPRILKDPIIRRIDTFEE